MSGDRGAVGFTLIEVLIAILLLVLTSVGVAQLVAMATKAIRASREQALTVLLAAAKMEQLRALEWTYVSTSGVAVERSDFTTNLIAPDLSGAGLGLSSSPAGALAGNTSFHAEYLDGRGRWAGSGALPPPDAVFVRRWAIVPVPADPARSLVLQVLVTTVQQDRQRGGPWRIRSGTEAALVTVLTRKE